uniref:G_PROTEIN_RECEP_F1_2 domain-containing protein n=1 Tax=Romanomermis culicivorax TaxID=13658 RepID=A0A915IZX3_ROMCU
MTSACSLLTTLLSSNSTVENLTLTATAAQDSVTFLKRVSYAYVLPTIVGVGVFGDAMSILVLSHPLMRLSGVIYSYLLALAVTDIFTLLSTMPMVLWLTDIKFCSWLWAWYYAHIGFPLANAFMCASVWIVVSNDGSIFTVIARSENPYSLLIITAVVLLYR